ncbi:MAG: signal peptidase I [Candidatus Bipolaricaulota bacterium]|nr:signal peptidase I [Candidatus Bipolaricaulota bacterium]
MMSSRHKNVIRQRKKEKKPAWILRLVNHYGWYPSRVTRVILEWIEIIAVAGLLAFLVIYFITVRMSVPTGSMIPSIELNDSFFVDKVSYYFRDPNPGDMIVFWHTDAVYIDRVDRNSPAAGAGIEPGARLVYINRQPVFSARVASQIIDSLSPGTDVVLRFSGHPAAEIGPKPQGASSLLDFGIRLRERRVRYVKRLIAVGGQRMHIEGGDVYVDGEKLTGPRFDRYYYSNDPQIRYGVGPTLVPEGKFFVLGDNSANSWDSRYWGFVDEDDFIGEPYFRVWPFSRFGPMNGYFHL